MTISRRQFTAGSLGLLAARTWARVAPAQPRPLRALIVDGINNHDWITATHAITEILTATGLFVVDVSTTPPRGAPAEAWSTWRPEFARYDVVINNFNGGHQEDGIEWPPAVQQSLETYVRGGGGLVVYHAANNAFLKWKAYNDMIGLGWRSKTFGPGLFLSDDDQVNIIPQDSGLEPGHPERFAFPLHMHNPRHPITAGMPPVWMHPSEQLTHGQHGPAQGLTILTYAHSPVSNQNEPMDWVRDYGQGRVYTTMLGHTWVGESTINLDCVGFQTLLARGTEWAATAAVTIPIPTAFPGPDAVSLHKLT